MRSVQRAAYGGLIYVGATPSGSVGTVSVADEDVCLAEQFGARCARLRAGASRRVSELAGLKRSLGIYVPGRVLMWVDPSSQLRFFDDDADLRGHFYPPFTAAIESCDDLVSQPVDELWIMSKSVGKKIASELAVHESLRKTNIVLVDDLLREFSRVR